MKSEYRGWTIIIRELLYGSVSWRIEKGNQAEYGVTSGTADEVMQMCRVIINGLTDAGK